ncbi:MAG: FtsX-like permease family protein [Bacteroidota bacterium]
MMMVIFAWKNIWRNKKRSLVILAATAVGLAAGLFSVGLMTGMYDSMVDSSINRGLGNIQLHTHAYKRDQLIRQTLPESDSIVHMLQSMPDIRSFATHSTIEGMASSATIASGVMIIAIDPELEKQTTAISTSIVEGSYLETRNSIVIGKKLAEKLKIKLHSRIVLSFSGADGNIMYAAFRISGIFRSDASLFDAMNVFIRQKDLAELLGTPAPIHEIIIRTYGSALLDSTQRTLQRSLPDAVLVETWRDISPELKLVADMTDVINIFFLGLILFALLFGLTNTLMMSVLDRVRDFGVLLAVGMYRRRLFSMIILESLFLSFTGGVIGVIVGWSAVEYYQAQGINLAVISEGLSAYGIPSMLYPYIRLSVYGQLTIMMIVTSIIAALYPAVKAVRLKPVEAIRTIA